MALSEKQQKALEALVSGCNRSQAADIAGVNRSTVTRWLNGNEEFAAAVREARSDVFADAKDLLKATVGDVAKFLRDVVRNAEEKTSDRLIAARMIRESVGWFGDDDAAEKGLSDADVKRRIAAIWGAPEPEEEPVEVPHMRVVGEDE